jgi:hypothetical protein
MGTSEYYQAHRVEILKRIREKYWAGRTPQRATGSISPHSIFQKERDDFEKKKDGDKFDLICYKICRGSGSKSYDSKEEETAFWDELDERVAVKLEQINNQYLAMRQKIIS